MYQIAVVDDDPAVSTLLTDWLKDILPGSDVQSFLELDPALASIASKDFDLVISDVDMGTGSDKFGGFKIAKALDTKRVPLLVISGSPEYEVQAGVFSAMEAWDYLQKPISAGDFALQVKRAIAFRKSLSETEHAVEGEFALVPDLKICRRPRHTVQWKGQRLQLSMSQMDIVEVLAQSAGQSVTDKKLFEFIASGKNIANLRVKISAIREEFKSVDSQFDRIRAVPIGNYQWRID